MHESAAGRVGGGARDAHRGNRRARAGDVMRTLLRGLRTIMGQPFWFILIGALILGVSLGTLVARETTNDVLEAVFGNAWRKSTGDTRSFLMTMLSLQLTVLA